MTDGASETRAQPVEADEVDLGPLGQSLGFLLRLTEAGQAHLDRHGPSFHAFGLMRVPELTEAEHATLPALLRRYLRLDDERAGRRPRITPPLPQTVTGGRRQ